MQQGRVTRNSQRQIVSYFDHEFIKPTPAKLDADITEMQVAGFTNVVLCVTESDIRTKHRRAYIAEAAQTMQSADMEVWADPWAVGGVFGGEGISHFRNRGEVCCDHNPELERLLDPWLHTVAESGISTVFWDEPEMHCRDDQGMELPFLEKYTGKAGALALENVVCLCANRKKKRLLGQVATLPYVVEVATDPYFENAFEKIDEAQRLQYVTDWVTYTKETAKAHGKRSHVWVQTFGVPEGREAMIDEHIAIVDAHGVDIAVWGFHGCESVPNFVKPGNTLPRTAWNRTVGALALRHAA